MSQTQLIKIAAQVFQVPEASLSMETGMGDIDAWDSLGHLRLMMEIEQEYGVRFSTEQLRLLTSLSEIQQALLIEERH
ncbi:acyl carrier protein [Dictyobacter aurantiacus]|uniref:Acyl carrier protein n=1 Tax=Dictyobacter aurantiacus TaxID=1936993 RepID=A0A401ZKP3_9CHLR|nr:acyl carrier protein [Dictyobacter aurantiacus]GCE07384.1 acyl carrier protein [Dictyobacter aurantiacus]